ncbi:MAG TPA: hypothetical protein VGD65_04830 [Chryseosolibacter sp.]
MSQAFVRETDDQWLNEVAPTLHALTVFLTRENGGIRVYEQKNFTDDRGRTIYVMSNGLSYSKNEKGEWFVVS